MSKARLTVVSEICSTDLLIYFLNVCQKRIKSLKKKQKKNMLLYITPAGGAV